ncbi:hypothetical protein MycrhDRAFT_0817 [Mycolicibacterium rhodesiae JS60]|nr:hypothetical protein MycrhDRAFT_0817 [Mycolicibacterium rhodesiae JS60]
MDWQRPYLGWAATAVGASAVIAALASNSTQVGQGFALGFAAFVTFFGVVTVLATDRRPAYWGLVVVGLAAVIVPFLGAGYTPDRGSSWTCWVAGTLAMIIGGIGWTSRRSARRRGADNAHIPTQRSATSFWIGRAALAVGLATILAGVAASSAATATAAMLGLGALIAVIGVWSLLAVDPTHDFLTLSIAGFALFLSPSVGGFAAESAAWAAWVAGGMATALGAAGHLRSSRLDVTAAMRTDADEHYRKVYRSADEHCRNTTIHSW